MPERSAGDLAIVLHSHMPYVEGFGTYPFGEEWLFDAVIRSHLPLLEVIRSAAANDPELAELWETNIAQRHLVQLRLAEALAAKTPLRGGITAARTADIALATLAPETYRLLVHERGWTEAEWESWATDALTLQLLPSERSGGDDMGRPAPEDAR